MIRWETELAAYLFVFFGTPGFDRLQRFLRLFNPGRTQVVHQRDTDADQLTFLDLKAGLKDTVKALSEELELKPALINKAISIAHRDNYKAVADDMDMLDSILSAAGKI